jgi:predicted AlkP superfamily pyrophosphatase or phosphodiesterase
MIKDASLEMILNWKKQKPLIKGLASELVFPGYDGTSLVNLSASICCWLGAPFHGRQLGPEYHQPFLDKYQHILLLVCDGLGLSMLQKMLQGDGEILRKDEREELFNKAYLYPLTSVIPSTTSTALTSLWTGSLPCEHGIVGYEIWLKEYGMVTNMIKQTAASFAGDSGGLVRAGFDANKFLPVQSISAHLNQHRVQTHFYIDAGMAQSGLTIMHMPEAHIHPFFSLSDARLSLQAAMVQKETKLTYSAIYWPLIDTLAHRYGPDDERVELEIENFMRHILLLMRFLKKKKVKDTLILITADHGLISTPVSDHFDLAFQPDFVSTLAMMPNGESRLPYFYVRAGREKQFVNLFNQIWGADFVLFKTQYLVAAGLFGAEPEHPQLDSRLGDYIAIPKGNSYLWWKPMENKLLGRHGGLMPEEMLVPLMVWEL